jgi:DNA-directed RNA polymerase specialized sigma24 family protein
MAKPYYVKNSDLLPHIHEYRETGIVSEELGGYLYKIAFNYANKGSFYGYTWKEDMVSEAVLTCIKYMYNFNPMAQKRPNPFAYFTTIIHNAFLNYIRKQKKHSKIKDICWKNCYLLDKEEIYQTKAIDYRVMKRTDDADEPC